MFYQEMKSPAQEWVESLGVVFSQCNGNINVPESALSELVVNYRKEFKAVARWAAAYDQERKKRIALEKTL